MQQIAMVPVGRGLQAEISPEGPDTAPAARKPSALYPQARVVRIGRPEKIARNVQDQLILWEIPKSALFCPKA